MEPGVIRVEDTQQEQASSSADVRVQRVPGGVWEEATAKEKEELARHDNAVREEEKRQAEHDEMLWTNHQAALARSWDDWVLQTEMDAPARTRPLKRFKVKVTITDSEHNELAVTSLSGEVDVGDAPQVNFVVQEQIIQAPVDEEMEAAGSGPAARGACTRPARRRADRDGGCRVKCRCTTLRCPG